MNSFKVYFKKEIMESIRSYRYIILAAVFIGYGILDPVLLKMLPAILEKQGDAGIDYSQLFRITQVSALQSFMGNLFQMGILVLVLCLMGVVSEEIKNYTFVLPSTKKLSFGGVVLSKSLHYSLLMVVLIFSALMVNYYYITTLFQDDFVTFQQVMKSGFFISCYFIFIINLLVCISSFFKKGGIVSLVTLGISLSMPFLSQINALRKVLPYYFLQRAGQLSQPLDSSIILPLILLVTYIVLLNIIAILKLNRVELS